MPNRCCEHAGCPSSVLKGQNGSLETTGDTAYRPCPVLEDVPEGLVIVDRSRRVLWANRRAEVLAGAEAPVAGKHFYKDMFPNVRLLHADFAPLSFAFRQRRTASTSFATPDGRILLLEVVPRIVSEAPPTCALVLLRDVTEEREPWQRLNVIYEAGLQLAEIAPQDLIHRTSAQRIELLRERCLRFLRDVLRFKVFEIRLVTPEPATGRMKLVPLIADGMSEEAAKRVLYVAYSGSGITGYVAASGLSYICDDTLTDNLYLQGTGTSRSSLTVPLIKYEAGFQKKTVIGTVNVESDKPRDFNEKDRLFLELFSRDLVVALNALDLIAVEEQQARSSMLEAVHGKIAQPVETITNTAARLWEQLDSPEMPAEELRERLRGEVREIIRAARSIKEVVWKVGETLPPTEATPTPPETQEERRLAGKRFLIVHENPSVRTDVDRILSAAGGLVETAARGADGLRMVRATGPEGDYAAILVANILPDMGGADFIQKVKEILRREPSHCVMIITFGVYDPDHNQVKARRLGVTHFVGDHVDAQRLIMVIDQLLSEEAKSPTPDGGPAAARTSDVKTTE
ncbi:MAG: GAF domain-containing protein [Thermogutta sp.]|nr:GAF domain-containing protein [Thermogutta sp.]